MNLSTPLETAFRLQEKQKKALKKLGLHTVEDLLFHFPVRYGDTASVKNIGGLSKGEQVTLYGRISKLDTKKSFRGKTPMAEGRLTDEQGDSIKLVWFNQPYIAKMIKEDGLVQVDGKVSARNKTVRGESIEELSITNPQIKMVNTVPTGVGDSLFGTDGGKHSLYPVYPESQGITSNWIYHSVLKIFKQDLHQELIDPLPPEMLERYRLPQLASALIYIHAPQKETDALAARKRFSFEEVFFIQTTKQKAKHEFQSHKAFYIEKSIGDVQEFIDRFPFKATNAQTKAIEQILSDFSTKAAASRLLEGDVGSGKTAVAATAVYAVTTSKIDGTSADMQTAYMAPTEILAKQQFENFIQYFSHLGIKIGLLTSSGCRKFPSKVDPESSTDISKNQLLKWIASGEITVVVGTHSLIQKSVKFRNLAFVVIDEQHRFGISQRKALVRGSDSDKTRMNADVRTENGGLLYKDLTYRVRSAIFKVANELGLGHKEVVYQKALAEEFTVTKLSYNREKQMPIYYRNKKVGVYQPDFIVEDMIIVELKALPFIGAKEKKQLWSYIKGSDYKLALLVNFGPRKVDVQRIIYDNARESASHPRQSASGQRSVSVCPHLLTMTATPIPRTLALTVYGDLDISVINELPAGRKPPVTRVIPPAKREGIYEDIRKELDKGKQMYVICPRIDEPDPTKENVLMAKSAKEEAKRLQKKVFPEYTVGVLHGKLTPKEKEEVMREFESGKIQVLVSTTVVEVGVNVPNATLMIIEGAERFGLAQLHQLRGRIIRSNHQPYCYIFSESSSKKTLERLNAMQQTSDGFKLAEYDLQFRGAGELYGGKQSGISDIGMEAMKNIKLVEAAREEARNIIEQNPTLSDYPEIQKRVAKREDQLHLE